MFSHLSIPSFFSYIPSSCHLVPSTMPVNTLTSLQLKKKKKKVTVSAAPLLISIPKLKHKLNTLSIYFFQHCSLLSLHQSCFYLLITSLKLYYWGYQWPRHQIKWTVLLTLSAAFNMFDVVLFRFLVLWVFTSVFLIAFWWFLVSFADSSNSNKVLFYMLGFLRLHPWSWCHFIVCLGA